MARANAVADLPAFVEDIGRAASAKGVAVLFLHASGTLPQAVEMSIGEIADGILTYGWRDGGSTKRRSLFITKLRGLAPGLGGEHIPVFETSLVRGPGFILSRVNSVV